MESQLEGARRKLRERLELKQSYLGRVSSLADTVPLVQQSSDLDRWQLEVLDSAPPEAFKVELGNVPAEVELGNQFTKQALLTILHGEPIDIVSVVSTSSGGTVSILDYMNRASSLGTPAVSDWYQSNISTLRDLQQQQDLPGRIRTGLSRLNSQSLSEMFQIAVDAYFSWKAGTERRTDAANAMRIVLDKMKGELFSLANLQSEGKGKTWTAMAKRLKKGESGGKQEELLLQEWGKRQALYQQLSEIAKRREEGCRPFDLENLWMMFLEHMNAVLGLVAIKPADG